MLKEGLESLIQGERKERENIGPRPMKKEKERGRERKERTLEILSHQC